MSDERRHAPRHHAYIGAEIDLGDGPVRSAITHDGSATGLMLLTRASLEIGHKVNIKCFLAEGRAIPITGKVVRQEDLDPEENSLWRVKVAVVMDAPSDELAEHFEELAQRQAKTYGSG